MLQIVHEALRAKARGGAGGSSSSGAAGGARPPPKCELSSEDRDAVFSIREGTRCQSRAERAWGGGRGTVGAFAGKVYYEVSVALRLGAGG